MDLNRDELRRQLKAVDEENSAAMKPWREALMRVFSGETQTAPGVRAELAGAPDRRSFLRIGGLTVAGAAVLAACSSDPKGSQSGTTLPETTTAVGTPSTGAPTTAGPVTADDRKTDLALLRTATSVELLAVAVYGKAEPLIKDADIRAAARLFASQHSEHAQQLQGATRETFGADKVYKQANAVLKKNLVDPVLPTLQSDTDIVKFAMSIEDSAAATYVTAAGALSGAKLRQAIMAIGGIEARHAAILAGVLHQSVPTASLWSTQDAVSSDAFV
ncbi:MAG: ferritin-like domain-containing protein [Actinomycetota bacterium]|nr:ferritin-like domain-containing protein [Actinomycetota bacterium]